MANLVFTQIAGEVIDVNGTNIGARSTINVIPGTNITVLGSDNAGSDRVDLTITGGAAGTPIQTVNAGTVTSPPFGPLYQFTDPTIPSFTWVNQGTTGAAVANSNQTTLLTVPNTAAHNWRMRVITAPATPYKISIAFQMSFPWNNGGATPVYAGLVMRESSTGKFQAFTSIGAGGFGIISSKFTNETTFAANYQLQQQVSWWGPVIWLQMADNGTNITCGISGDGLNFTTFTTVSRTDFMLTGPNQVGFAANNLASAVAGTFADNNLYMRLLSWKQT